jgi:hypothetical protein
MSTHNGSVISYFVGEKSARLTSSWILAGIVSVLDCEIGSSPESSWYIERVFSRSRQFPIKRSESSSSTLQPDLIEIKKIALGCARRTTEDVCGRASLTSITSRWIVSRSSRPAHRLEALSCARLAIGERPPVSNQRAT